MDDYLLLDSEPKLRPKVYKIQVKQYGLKKAVRVGTRKNNKTWTIKKSN